MPMINKKVLVSDANNFSIDQPINPHYSAPALDKEKAKQEHHNVVDLFKQAGIEVLQVPSPNTSQDGIYTANWALVREGQAILARLPNARSSEEAYAQRILINLGLDVHLVPDNLRFSGQGDSLPCGKYLIAGSGYRSDVEAQKFAADTFGLELVQLKTVAHKDADGKDIINHVTGWPDSFFYDIDLAVAIIRDDLIAYCPEALEPDSQEIMKSLDIEKIEVSLDEAMNGFGCNLVSTGQTVIMSPNAPNLKQELEARGLQVLTTEISELSKGGGFIRCISLTLD